MSNEDFKFSILATPSFKTLFESCGEHAMHVIGYAMQNTRGVLDSLKDAPSGLNNSYLGKEIERRLAGLVGTPVVKCMRCILGFRHSIGNCVLCGCGPSPASIDFLKLKEIPIIDINMIACVNTECYGKHWELEGPWGFAWGWMPEAALKEHHQEYIAAMDPWRQPLPLLEHKS